MPPGATVPSRPGLIAVYTLPLPGHTWPELVWVDMKPIREAAPRSHPCDINS